MPGTKRYIVKRDALHIDHKTVLTHGDPVELDDAQAASLVALGAVELANEGKAKAKAEPATGEGEDAEATAAKAAAEEKRIADEAAAKAKAELAAKAAATKAPAKKK